MFESNVERRIRLMGVFSMPAELNRWGSMLLVSRIRARCGSVAAALTSSAILLSLGASLALVDLP